MALEVVATAGLFALLPRLICTEMLACDKSKPELSNDCVSVANNLLYMITSTLYKYRYFHVKPREKNTVNQM